MIILDTDHISALQYREAPKAFALQARLEILSLDEIATIAITVEEQTRGWLGLIRRNTDSFIIPPLSFIIFPDLVTRGVSPFATE